MKTDQEVFEPVWYNPTTHKIIIVEIIINFTHTWTGFSGDIDIDGYIPLGEL